MYDGIAESMIAEPVRAARFGGEKRLGLVLIALGIAAVLLALIAGATASKRSTPTLCPGQSAVFGKWTASLAAIQPVAGQDFTALEAKVSARWREQPVSVIHPQLRQYIDLASAESGVVRLNRWNGMFSAQPLSFNRSTGCMVFDLRWHPLRNWLGYGAGLALIGLLLVLSKRLAYAASASKFAVNVTFAVIVLGIVATSYWFLHVPDLPFRKPFQGGPALIEVRNQLLNDGRASTNRWVIIADAMTRHGQYADAATVLLGAVENSGNDAEAWLALGDALYSAQGGQLSQAAVFAYDRAGRAAHSNLLPPPQSLQRRSSSSPSSP
jgi:hypothetical protein